MPLTAGWLAGTHHTCHYGFEACPILLDKSSTKEKLVSRISLQCGAWGLVAASKRRQEEELSGCCYVDFSVFWMSKISSPW